MSENNKNQNKKIEKSFWKSLESYQNDSKLNLENEFEEGVTDDFNPSQLNGISRRKFLALLSASAAFTAAGCSDYHDQGEIVPYTNRPEGILPGSSNYYASTCNGCSVNCGILIKTNLGRPIKIDGNTENPINNGKICAKGQASILDLYDPSRIRKPLLNGRETNWSEVDNSIIAELNKVSESGKKIVLVTHSVHSPTFKSVLDKFLEKYPAAEVYSYELFNNHNRLDGWERLYGNRNFPKIRFDKADVILSLESDFLGKEDNFIENTRLFAKKRDVNNPDEFSRLYSAEGSMSLTGMNADYRFRVNPSNQIEFVLSLLNELRKNARVNISLPDDLESLVSNYSLSRFSEEKGIDQIKLNYLLEDLLKPGKNALVYAGNALPLEVHYVVNIINEILNSTNLYAHTSAAVEVLKLNRHSDFQALGLELSSGNVGAFINLGSNPVYHFQDAGDWKQHLSKVALTLSVVVNENETSENCKYVLPAHHYLESWGDSQTTADVYSLRQPVIAPLYNSRQTEGILLAWTTGQTYTEDLYHNYLMENFKSSIFAENKSPLAFKNYWLLALHDGFVKIKTEDKTLTPEFTTPLQIPNSSKSNEFTLSLTENYFIGDGRFANNGWLQELPHPVSKITWDNYLNISPKRANDLNLKMGDMVEVTSGDKKLEVPILVQPGMADDVISIELGYGRTNTGEVGKNVGFNSNIFLTSNHTNTAYFYNNVSIKKTGNFHKLISTQEHHAVDDSSVKDFHKIRNIIQEGTVDQYRNDPEFLQHHKHKIFSITEEHKYEGNKWAMAIDMNKCTSCSVCVASCNVENNVPVVGKDQVENGREMQWMRLDRYYSGTPEDPEVSNQPMLCQHCDNAPCENVCPVNATNHSTDGLNQMVYNRCVGTRYCANNCPYKVRRFNFFNFRDYFADAYYDNEVTPLVNNPEVTVRSRGVMEKCSFCIQRIMEARSTAIKENRELKTDEVTTACQQACPADAIVFGDMNDENSAVNKLRKHNLAYHVLEETNVKPNVTYIAKLRNIHSEDA